MPVYLDHAATAPMPEAVIGAYAEALREVGNPSSVHAHGQAAKRLLEDARERLAAVLDCEPIEVLLTSGGTESINLALVGLHRARSAADPARRLIVVPDAEHHAVLDSVSALVDGGAEAVRVPVDAEAAIDPGRFADTMGDGRTVSVATALLANNEVGTVQPVSRLAAIAAGADVPLHVDAVSALGSIPVSFRDSGATALSVSAHKVGGPVGVGALVLARRAALLPILHGGGQQRRLRPGTMDAAGARAFAVAAELATHDLPAAAARVAVLRDRLVEGVRRIAPDARLHGAPPGPRRLPGNAHFTFPGTDADSLLLLLDMAGVSASTGAACQAGVQEPSHVLLATGVDERVAGGAIRTTLGRGSTAADVDAFLAALPEALARATRP